MTRPCTGPVRDRTCGVWYCPLDPAKEPLEDQSWDECCEDCMALRDWHDELAADCARES
jgi:alpha-D-ribose 1-methylphosphonate 5-phosphate C-P lyase